MRHAAFLGAAVAAAALAAAPPASACPGHRTRVSPPPGSTIPSEGAVITVEGARWHFRGVEERGPALSSAGDTVELRVLRNDGSRLVMTPTRPLMNGTRYTLVLTRTATGFGLDRAHVPLRQASWVVEPIELRPAVTTPVAREGCGSGGVLGKLALFGALPFGAGYLGVTWLCALRRARQRRALDRLEV